MTVLLCRGCCCGTTAKHPDVDHADQQRVLERAAAEAGARFRITDCLGACQHSNVVVVRTGPPGTGRTFWLGGLLHPHQTAALATFLHQPNSSHGDSQWPPLLRQAPFEPDAEANGCLAALAPTMD